MYIAKLTAVKKRAPLDKMWTKVILFYVKVFAAYVGSRIRLYRGKWGFLSSEGALLAEIRRTLKPASKSNRDKVVNRYNFNAFEDSQFWRSNFIFFINIIICLKKGFGQRPDVYSYLTHYHILSFLRNDPAVGTKVNSIRNLRFDLMKATQIMMRKEFEKQLLSMLDMEGTNEKYKILFDRFYGYQPTIRGFFGLIGYSALSSCFKRECRERDGINYFLSVQLPFILEIVISIQYYHNHIYDNKFGVNEESSIMHHIRASEQLESILELYLETKIPNSICSVVKEAVLEMFRYVDIGQELERERCTIANYKELGGGAIDLDDEVGEIINDYFVDLCEQAVWEEDESLPKKNKQVIRQYFERIFLTNAGIYYQAALLINTIIPTVEGERLVKYAALFGMMRQLVNDVSDFVPSYAQIDTKTRLAKDAMSDLRNGNITLPVILHLEACPKGRAMQYLENPNSWSSERELAIYEEMISNHAIFKSMSIARKIRDKALEELGENFPNYTFFEDMSRVADVNKFYRFFDQQAQAHKRKYKRTREASKSLSFENKAA